LILLFRYWQSRMRFRPRDLHFFIFCRFSQLFFRAELATPLLIPECAQPALRFDLEESHVPVCFPMHTDFA
jgi:hypothetical protein